jgi:hypothetical protein
MIHIPPELERYTDFLNAQPSDVQSTFYYTLCMMMVGQGRMELVNSQAGEDGDIYVFRSGTGEEYRVVRPDIGYEDDALMVRALKMVLRDEGMLQD